MRKICSLLLFVFTISCEADPVKSSNDVQEIQIGSLCMNPGEPNECGDYFQCIVLEDPSKDKCGYDKCFVCACCHNDGECISTQGSWDMDESKCITR